MLQLQMSNRVMLHVGPTINFLKTSYKYDEAFFYADFISSDVITRSTDVGYYQTQTRLIRTVYYASPPDYTTLKRWIGFEAGISYLVKFSRRP